MRNGQLKAYSDIVKDYIERGVFKELSQEEMDDWDGPVNYVSHHGVTKPRSTTTALRVVCNSSLDNNDSGVSCNNLLPKGPNTLVPLLQALITWRTYKEVVIWDYSRAYNTVRTFPEEMHMWRLVWRFDPTAPGLPTGWTGCTLGTVLPPLGWRCPRGRWRTSGKRSTQLPPR